MASSAADAHKYLLILDQKLKARNPEVLLWENYYEGIHRLQFATSRFRSIFGNLFREFADNWCELVVNASVERLNILGFRVGNESEEFDSSLAQIWEDNNLEGESRISHTEAVKLGEAYVLIDGENKVEGTDSPLITIEHPSQAITAHDPSNRRRRLAGMKQWLDDDGRICATIYMPDATYRFEARENAGKDIEPGLTVGGLVYPTDYLSSPSAHVGNEVEWVAREGVQFVTPNTFPVVPLIPLQNNPTLSMGGRSDLSVVIPVQDAVNKLVLDMIIASEFAAFPQRWATGLEVPKDPQSGRPLAQEQFLAAVSRLWVSEDGESKFGQFGAADLSNYVKAIEMLIQHLAALTKTPPHYLLGQSGNFPSGDSLTATETGLTSKTDAKKVDFNPTWRETNRLALMAKGEAEKANQRIEVMWADSERRIRAQRVDGAVKESTLGVPQDALWTQLGYSPEDIARFHEMKKVMGLDEYSSEFAVPPPLPEGAKPPNEGPEGNLQQQQAATTATRVARI